MPSGTGDTPQPTNNSNAASGHSEQHPEPLGRDHYGRIEEALGYSFQNYDWLERALTHRSLHSQGLHSDYERLEFLGDAVLDLSVAQLLLEKHKEAREGELSKMRAALVNTSSLAGVARRLNLNQFIRLSRGELANGGAERSSILADVFEALMGAVYREAGFLHAHACIERLFAQAVATVTPRDPKTELQELLHARGQQAPDYLLEFVEGPEHSPTFVSVVKIGRETFGRGRGATKKASQQEAAAEALRRLTEEQNASE